MNKNQSKKSTSLIIASVILAFIAVSFFSFAIYAKVVQPKKYSEYIQQGNKYLDENMYEDAVSIFDKALKINKESVEARIGEARGYIGMDNPNKAGEYLLQAQKIDLKNETLIIQLISIIKDEDREIAYKLLQNYLSAVGKDNISSEFKDTIAEDTDNEDLEDCINQAQNLYDNAVEGSENGNYKEGSKKVFLEAINEAKKVNEGYFYTQEEVDQMVKNLKIDISIFEAQKVNNMPSNLGDTYRTKLKNVQENLELRLEDDSLCNADMGRIVSQAKSQYEEILSDIYEDLLLYLPEKREEIISHRTNYEIEVAEKQYEFDNLDRMYVGTWMVTGVPDAFAEIAKNNCYDLIETYM